MSEPKMITVKDHKRRVAMEALNLLKNGKRVEESANPLKAQYYRDRQDIAENFKEINAELNEAHKSFNANTNMTNKNFNKIFALVKQLEARIKKIEVFMDESVEPSHREPEIKPKDTTVRPLGMGSTKPYKEGDEIDETRQRILRMEQKKKHGRRLM